MSEIIYETAADTAKKIRAALKATFPGVKFSVRSSRFSGGSSVDVSWTDGPTSSDVDTVLDHFQSGHFDGMQDMYVDGAYEWEGQLYHGAKYVSGQRTLSPAWRERCEAKAAEMFPEYNKNSWEYGRWLSAAEQALIAEVYPNGQPAYRRNLPTSADVPPVPAEDIEPSVPVQSDPYATPEYAANCHMKAWNTDVEALDRALCELHLPYDLAGGKFIFRGLSREQYAQVVKLNEANGAIIFDDGDEAERITRVYVNVRRVGWKDCALLDEELITVPAQYGRTWDHDAIKREIVTRWPSLASGDYAYSIGQHGDFDYVPPLAPRDFAPGEKVPVHAILFRWSESPVCKGGEMYTTWSDANALLMRIARAKDEGVPGAGGYDKTSFVVCFEDGYVYEGRCDVNIKDEDETNMSLHIRRFVEFHAGLYKPAHMTDEQYQDYLRVSGVDQQESRDFLDHYMLEDVPTPDPNARKPERGQVVNFFQAKAEKLTNWTPEQRLMLVCVGDIVKDETVIAQALASGITPEQLFSTAARLADAMRNDAQ